MTQNPAQAARSGKTDAFIVKLSSTGSLIYSTYLGGTSEDAALSIASDGSENVYIAGATESTDFPVLNPAKAVSGGSFDAFAAKLTSAGSLEYSSRKQFPYLDAGWRTHRFPIHQGRSGQPLLDKRGRFR